MAIESRMRPASEIASRIVGDPTQSRETGAWSSRIGHDVTWLRTPERSDAEAARDDCSAARAIVAETIEQARYDGAVETLREAADRIEAAANRADWTRAEGLMQAAGIARELASRPRRS
jgi:hypothetical protein